MTYVAQTDEDHAAIEAVTAKMLPDETIKEFAERVKKATDDALELVWYKIEDYLKSDQESALADVAYRMAQRFVDAVLAGDEETARHAFALKHYDGRDKAREAAFGHTFYEPGPIELRRKLVEAHADLLRDARVADLEAQLEGRDKEIGRLTDRILRLEGGLP